MKKALKVSLTGAVMCLALVAGAESQSTVLALRQAVQGTPAIAVVLDVKTGKLLASMHQEEAMKLRSAPGSTLKPFFLAQALEHGLVRPQTTVHCSRTLHITGRNVDCTHPQTETVFNAEQALAYSCNSYFAEIAKRFTSEGISATLREYGLTESAHFISTEPSPDKTQLLVLGLENISVTPVELAAGYRRLALQWGRALPEEVKHGLQDSVQYGMAHNAYVDGLSIAGKTGTASDPGQAWTHGWFAALAPADAPKVVIVIFLPRGNGADAAHLAQRFFSAYKEALR